MERGYYQRHNCCQHLSEILDIHERHLHKTILTQISKCFGKVWGASKRLKKMFSNRGGEIVCLEWLGRITLGSYMIYFSVFHSLTSDYTVCNTIFLFRSSCLQIFFKNSVAKNFATFRPATLLRRVSNIGVFLWILQHF